MLKRMVNALRGSVRLEVSGAFPERFLNLCAQRGIVFWNVEWLEATRLRLTVTRQGSGRPGAGGQGAVYRGAGGTVRRALFSGPVPGGAMPCWWGWPFP